jgi:serine/threonine-protein kinase
VRRVVFGLWIVANVIASCHAEPPESPVARGTLDAAPAIVGGDVASPSFEDAAEASRDLDAGAGPAPEGMLFVPGGTFTMGADEGGEPDERPAHAVTLAAFWLDRVPVTNDDWAKCVAERACRPNDRASVTHAGRDEDFLRPRQPVVGVSWTDAQKYCARLGKRLPREAEYERAARGDDGRRFAWGNEPPTPERAVYGRNFGHDAPDEVGAHPAGRGPYGHDDLAGNVWEWTDDEYDPFAYARKTASEGVPGSCNDILLAFAALRADGGKGFTGSNPIPNECEHVLRGGAWNYFSQGLRATNRVHHPARFRATMAGFRCARDATGRDG